MAASVYVALTADASRNLVRTTHLLDNPAHRWLHRENLNGKNLHLLRTKWSHIHITFTEADIKLTSFPHMDAMVITAHIDKWNVMRALVHNGSQTEILFLSTFEQMGLSKKQLKEALKPLYGVERKLNQ
jgi:hypothetical protein